MPSICSLYITCKDLKEGEKISSALLDSRLIACANIFPVKSIYLWKGKKEKNKEFAMICKTLKEKLPEIENMVKKLHSYDMPFISAWEEMATKEAVRWIEKEMKP